MVVEIFGSDYVRRVVVTLQERPWESPLLACEDAVGRWSLPPDKSPLLVPRSAGSMDLRLQIFRTMRNTCVYFGGHSGNNKGQGHSNALNRSWLPTRAGSRAAQGAGFLWDLSSGELDGKEEVWPSSFSSPSFSASLASITAANSVPSAPQVVVLPGSSQPLFLTFEPFGGFCPFCFGLSVF